MYKTFLYSVFIYIFGRTSTMECNAVFSNHCIVLHLMYLPFEIYSKQQKQPSTCVLKKRFSQNMQQIYRRTPMPKCDFNNLHTVMISLARQDENWFMPYCTVGALVQSNFIEITPRHGYSPVNLLHIFRTPFLKYTSGRLLLAIISFKRSTINLLIRKTLSVFYVIKCKAIFKHFSFYLKVSL